MMVRRTLHCPSPEATMTWGYHLGALLQEGDFVALDGDLGAGKTVFCSGIALGCGVQETVSSPTYLLCHEFQAGSNTLLHLDAYFKERMDGLLLEGLATRFGQAITLVEWASHVGEWQPEGTLSVSFEKLQGARKITVKSSASEWEKRLSRLPDQVESGKILEISQRIGGNW